MPERTFDYHPRLDPRSRSYRVGAPSADLSLQSRFWVPGSVVTDQGSEGACVGHGVTNEWLASPARGRSTEYTANRLAQQIYREAQKIDEWEGEDYEGTSVRAGMLVGRARGWWEGFRWAFNMAELRTALEEGPIVIGVEWRERMYAANAGRVVVGGQVVGGHCLLLTGYTPHHLGLRSPAYRWRNSWGVSYGINGSAYIATADLDSILFRSGGEAAVAIGRK